MDVKLQLEKGHIYSRVSYIKQTTLPIKANGNLTVTASINY